MILTAGQKAAIKAMARAATLVEEFPSNEGRALLPECGKLHDEWHERYGTDENEEARDALSEEIQAELADEAASELRAAAVAIRAAFDLGGGAK